MKRTALLLALFASPFAVQAADLSYSWLEADYVHTDPDFGRSSDGLALHGSGAISDNFYVTAGGNKLNDGGNIGGLHFDDSKNYTLGFGYHTPVASNVDLIAEVNYLKYKGSFDEDGYGARVGVRASLSPNFEAGAAIAYGKLHRFDSNTALDLTAQYKFSPTFGIAAEALVGNNDNSYLIGPRVSF